MNQTPANSREINFRLTVAEANMILHAVGKRPFAKVYQLVAKLQHQASEQLGPAQELEGSTHAE